METRRRRRVRNIARGTCRRTAMAVPGVSKLPGIPGSFADSAWRCPRLFAAFVRFDTLMKLTSF